MSETMIEPRTRRAHGRRGRWTFLTASAMVAVLSGVLAVTAPKPPAEAAIAGTFPLLDVPQQALTTSAPECDLGLYCATYALTLTDGRIFQAQLNNTTASAELALYDSLGAETESTSVRAQSSGWLNVTVRNGSSEGLGVVPVTPAGQYTLGVQLEGRQGQQVRQGDREASRQGSHHGDLAGLRQARQGHGLRQEAVSTVAVVPAGIVRATSEQWQQFGTQHLLALLVAAVVVVDVLVLRREGARVRLDRWLVARWPWCTWAGSRGRCRPGWPPRVTCCRSTRATPPSWRGSSGAFASRGGSAR